MIKAIVQRPLFAHYEEDFATYEIFNVNISYVADLLVAPVQQPKVAEWKMYLPKNEDWIHV